MALAGSSTARDRLDGAPLVALVRAAAAGDQSSWAALVREFDGMLWAVARAHRLGEADATDVVQATWLKLFEHLGRLHEPSRVGAWLVTTARRECLGVLRNARRNTLYGDEAPECEAPDPSPDELLATAERDDALRRSFSRLRPSDQSLLRLLLAEPRPAYEEISAALGIPIGSIGPTRARALVRLRRELFKEDAFVAITG